MSDGGKGDKQRPTNHRSFAENFDRIFGKKNTEQERSGTMEGQQTSGETNGSAPNLPRDTP